MANRLAQETSPYLLQHKDNPVDWRPWGPEVLELARSEDKPILLSIGYSACHWCHVMERESFEDAETAAYMNEHFVPVKVDREERPDVDAIYMEAIQGMTGQGGWPLTAFLDSDGVPFFGGTYFPPDERPGLPSFRMVMEAVIASWESERERIREAAARIREQLAAIGKVQPSDEPIEQEVVDAAIRSLRMAADMRLGGFGGPPKFPPASALELLMTRGVTDVVEVTLDAMAHGGIYDQIGGGFARYSVDERWLVPHFEKMLYDNALLARVYLHGWQVLGHDHYRRVATETLDWALREMRGPEGGFYSALDADSEGEEGRFYVWNEDEIREVLSGAGFAEQEIEPLLARWGVNRAGNFEGQNIIHLPLGARASNPERYDEARQAVYEHRTKRVWPGLDDKRLCSWNALMIAALADAGAVLGRADYLEAAVACAEFVWERMRDDVGRLLRTWKDGEARLMAYLEDHAFLTDALTVLYEATFDVRWFDAAEEVADSMIERFADPELGGFFTTAHDHEELVARRKDIDDHPIPSGNSAAALSLLRLGALTGDAEYERHAVSVMRLFHRAAAQHPTALAHLLRAIDLYTSPRREVAVVGPAGADLAPLAGVVRGRFRPHVVLAGGAEGAERPELMQGRTAVDGRPAAYVCERFACQRPVTEPAELASLLGDS
jgi:uncharacterized protein YyaL (SSP411 family)